MDLTVSPNDPVQMASVLTQLRLLIKDVLLPRISNLECDLRDLRKATWPICQALKETSQIGDICSKKLFLECLEGEEVKDLLKLKAEFSKQNEITGSTSNLLEEELVKVMSLE